MHFFSCIIKCSLILQYSLLHLSNSILFSNFASLIFSTLRGVTSKIAASTIFVTYLHSQHWRPFLLLQDIWPNPQRWPVGCVSSSSPE